VSQYEDLSVVLMERIKHWKGKAGSGSTGFVVEVGDSVATVYGLNNVV
jgi:F-type H+-transporting ATPase subunit alpha